MGIYKTSHVVFGWKLPCDLQDKHGNKINVYEEEFLPYIEGHPGIPETIIKDGVRGDYVVFGLPLASVSDSGDFQYFDVPSKEYACGLRIKFEQLFKIDSPIEDPVLLLFIHGS